ncbi:MAG TPA: FxSxx-COOH system tetratricopeptide repeat protein, partial [Chloroflexota bacterium]|nr:FxSxx-COOH system tetratricopeptide repeat protein [Chloroflexota bacterium]
MFGKMMSDGDSGSSQIHVQGAMVGTAVDGGTVHAQNIAGRDIRIEQHFYPQPDPAARFPLIHLPYSRNPNFTGRETMLARLEAQLNAAQGTVVVSQAITGLGGVGKTQLALEYIYRHAAAYDVVWWLRADEETTLAADVAGLAVALGEHSRDNPDQQAGINAARRWLAQTDKRWLLLVDNADELPPGALEAYLPVDGNGHILVTSRRADWSGFVGPNAVLPLDVFTPDESLAFLNSRVRSVRSRHFSAFEGDESPTTNEELEEMAALAAVLGHFPLALEQAAAYVQRAESTLAEYRALFETRWRELWAEAQPPERYHATITTTWQVAFAKIRETAGAVELLNLCCFLAPENIPLDLVRAVPQTSDFFEKSDVSLSDPLVLNRAVAALRDYSLLKREGETVSLHRLVQRVARQQMGEERARQWVESAVNLLVKAWPFKQYDMTTWETSRVLLPHLQTISDLAAEYSVETENTALLNSHADFYLDYVGNLMAARPYSERALSIREKVLGPEHPHTAASLNNLGALLQTIGDYQGARPYYERALSIYEKVLGPEHPHTALSLNNLGGLLRVMGDYQGARPYYERALSIVEKVLGPEHPNTASSLNNLGYLLQAMGDY